jgi:N-acetyl-anhydromuramyl-L-alanine amidase AmpD
MKMKGFDYSDAQYSALIKLAKTLVEIFPLIKPDFARNSSGAIIKTELKDPKQYKGFICHFQVTKKKIDPIAFDFDRFLKGVGTKVTKIQPISPEENTFGVDEETDLDTWLERQTALKKFGYDPGPLDGDFGPKTRYALQTFQADQGLESDGIWGPKTESAVRYLLEELG